MKPCRRRDCEEPRYGRLSLCRKHHREKKRKKHSNAWSRRLLSGERKLLSSTASQLKTEAVSAYGGCCVGCGTTDAGQLQLDHVNNNGHQHRLHISRGRAGADFYRALKKKDWPNKEPYLLQLLCHDCHTTTTAERRYEP